jgi:hypothetical protein
LRYRAQGVVGDASAARISNSRFGAKQHQ